RDFHVTGVQTCALPISVIGGHGFATVEGFLLAAVAQQGAPAPRAGIATAGTVGEDFDFFHGFESCYSAVSRRLGGRARPTLALSPRLTGLMLRPSQAGAWRPMGRATCLRATII